MSIKQRQEREEEEGKGGKKWEMYQTIIRPSQRYQN
jgi:hypothetical protein